jgi:hypothetical protein
MRVRHDLFALLAYRQDAAGEVEHTRQDVAIVEAHAAEAARQELSGQVQATKMFCLSMGCMA